MKLCLRFLRHGGIGPMRSTKLSKPGAGVPPPVGRPRAQSKGATEGPRPCSSSAISSGRLFLDRVARRLTCSGPSASKPGCGGAGNSRIDERLSFWWPWKSVVKPPDELA
jgi:hypothetical protein